MQKARTPGAINIMSVFSVEPTVAKKGVENTLFHPSQAMLITATEIAVAGDSQNIVVGGLSSPMALSCIATWVKLQRRPLQTLAKRTSKNPERTNAVSEATINSTPAKMIRITMTKRTENGSSRKRNAKKRTNISEEDLHMAIGIRCQLDIHVACHPRDRRNSLIRTLTIEG